MYQTLGGAAWDRAPLEHGPRGEKQRTPPEAGGVREGLIG